MATLAKRSRKQIEQHISKCAESIQKNGLEIGRDLIEIRDEELWADEFHSWTEYCVSHLPELMPGYKMGSVRNMIAGAEIKAKIPDQTSDLDHSHFTELSRLAPTKQRGEGAGREKDYSKLRKRDVARVIKAAGPDPSVRDIRKAVDDELGIDRAKERAKRQAANEKIQDAIADKQRRIAQAEREREEAKRELGNYLTDLSIRLREALKNLQKVPGEGWDELEASKPGLCELVAQAADDLSDFMRGN